jgi:hypothetical protein
MTEQLEEQKNNFLLDVWAAMRRNQVVVMILYNAEENEYFIMRNDFCTDFDDTIKTFCELPFLGKISPQDTFEDWDEYFDDVALADIYGFELEDGQVQIAILDELIKPEGKNVIHEAYCNWELGGRLIIDGYNGDTVKGLHIPDDECEYDIDANYISMSCAMRWLREVKGVYINIRMTNWEHEYTTEPKLHFVADICDTKRGKWLDNDIWEETYEKCVEAAINYYYDYKK